MTNSTFANDSDRANNGSKDISISNVPLVGKRDSIEVRKQLADGTTEATTYRNSFQWEAHEDWQERLEQWLAIRSDFCFEALVTFVSFRLWSALAAVLLTYASPVGYVLTAALVVFLGVVGAVGVKRPSILPASSLRLFVVVVAIFS